MEVCVNPTPVQANPGSSCDRLETLLNDSIEKGAIDLPLLPQIASQVLSMIYDPNAEASKLAALIHQDQALAAHVIRIANSPAYMPRNPVVSLQHAVTMLGMNLLSEIAFTTSLKSAALKVDGFERRDQVSLAPLIGQRGLRQGSRTGPGGSMSKAHTCAGSCTRSGKVVLRTVVALSKEQKVGLEPGVVDGLLSGYHTRVGTLIAEKWALPKQVAESIAFYEHYGQSTVAPQECMTTCWPIVWPRICSIRISWMKRLCAITRYSSISICIPAMWMPCSP